jgi:diguanylate cyclase (GGDEF)-like protein
MAHHDALTGLPNRSLLEDRLHQAIARGRRESRGVAMLAIGLDHFKYVNESLGHAVGDLVLREAGRRLQRCLREGDTVARQGGDQFGAILGDVDSGGSSTIAAKVLEAFGRPFQVAGESLRVTASIGIGLHPADAEDAPGLMRAADSAMHAAKEQGRNTFRYFAADQNVASRARVQIASALHGALTPARSSCCTTSRNSTCAAEHSLRPRPCCVGIAAGS